MSSWMCFFSGFTRLLSITTPPLYRYPYRNSAEGLRGDMLRIGKDIDYVLNEETE